MTNVQPQDIVAYFDFDGTVTTQDTLIPFVFYVVGLKKFLLLLPMVIPIVLLYGLRIINNESAKQKFLTIMLRGYTKSFLEHKGELFALNVLDKYIKPEIYSRLEYHLEHHHNVVLVSANLAVYLRYWAKHHNLHGTIATELDSNYGMITGKLSTRNCYGTQKTVRIEQYLKQTNQTFAYSYGYGNSRGDYELLNYVNEGYWIDGTTMTPWSEQDGYAENSHNRQN